MSPPNALLPENKLLKISFEWLLAQGKEKYSQSLRLLLSNLHKVGTLNDGYPTTKK